MISMIFGFMTMLIPDCRFWKGCLSVVRRRGISFEEIIFCISRPGGLLDVVEHPDPERHGAQKVFIVAVRGYVYAVPFVEDSKRVFLKTIYPSRKLTRQYLEEGEENE